MKALKYMARGAAWSVLTVILGAVLYIGAVIVACW